MSCHHYIVLMQKAVCRCFSDRLPHALLYATLLQYRTHSSNKHLPINHTAREYSLRRPHFGNMIMMGCCLLQLKNASHTYTACKRHHSCSTFVHMYFREDEYLVKNSQRLEWLRLHYFLSTVLVTCQCRYLLLLRNLRIWFRIMVSQDGPVSVEEPYKVSIFTLSLRGLIFEEPLLM
jgi:hypothetical protein